MNAWQHIWRDIRTWLHRKRIFALDVEAYETLRLVAERQRRSPQEVAAQLFNQASQDQATQAEVFEHWERLSPRQMQIAAYLCRGDSTREIASHLHIAQTTVKSHVEIILRKFGLHSRVALRRLLEPWDLSQYL